MTDPDFQADLRRYGISRPFLKEQSIWAVYVYRLGRRIDRRPDGAVKKLLTALYWLAHRLAETVTGIGLPKSVVVGPGLRIWHFGGIFIHPGTVIGANCTLRQGVTIGNRHEDGPAPVLGDDVEIGAYAQVLGGIRLGNRCKVGAMAVVLVDVPDDAVAVGNPARIVLPASRGRLAAMKPVATRLVVGALAWALLVVAQPGVAATAFGTYERPFNAQSPWNARPVDPEFGGDEIPKSQFWPAMIEGTWSLGVFLARESDPPMTVVALGNKPGVYDPDLEEMRQSVTIPHWPAEVVPATGNDGHADIVDPTTGIVHSFFVLKNVDGQWRAAMYAWSPLAGRGWPDPGHYYQGARAAAVPASGGLIRKHEVADGDTMFRHALAMSLTYNGLSADPPYIFPAGNADRDAAKTNTGRIPEGALMMLPPDYDTSKIEPARLRKVAETLKVYGAYVVDRNVGTPFAIYVENGSEFSLHRPIWSLSVARELDRMRAALRQVVGAKGWLDGDGTPMEMSQAQNVLSLRGRWQVVKGDATPARYDSWRQALVFAAGGGPSVQTNTTTAKLMHPLAWGTPKPGDTYRLTVHASRGTTLRLALYDGARARLYESDSLADGQIAEFTWPANQKDAAVTVSRGDGGTGESTISATLVAVPALSRRERAVIASFHP